MEMVSLEGVLALGLLWLAFKAVVTVLLLLGAGRALRQTPLAPLVARMEAHLPRLPSWLRPGRSVAGPDRRLTP